MARTLSSRPCGLKLTTSGLSYLERRGGLDASCQSFRLEKTPPTNQAEIDAPNKAIERARKHFGISSNIPPTTACASAATLKEDRAKYSCH